MASRPATTRRDVPVGLVAVPRYSHSARARTRNAIPSRHGCDSERERLIARLEQVPWSTREPARRERCDHTPPLRAALRGQRAISGGRSTRVSAVRSRYPLADRARGSSSKPRRRARRCSRLPSHAVVALTSAAPRCDRLGVPDGLRGVLPRRALGRGADLVRARRASPPVGRESKLRGPRAKRRTVGRDGGERRDGGASS